jgi:hypothetical protein
MSLTVGRSTLRRSRSIAKTPEGGVIDSSANTRVDPNVAIEDVATMPEEGRVIHWPLSWFVASDRTSLKM